MDAREELELNLSILQALSQETEPQKPGYVSSIIEESALATGQQLTKLAKMGLSGRTGKKKNYTYQITDEGREYLTNPPTVEELEAKVTAADSRLGQQSKTEPGQQSRTGPGQEPVTDGPPIIPAQSDLFRDIGERLRIGVGRSGKSEGTPLDAVVYYVQRTADLDNLSSVYNALTEMGIANDVKKRWVKLYAQTVPGKEIPEDLKQKLESTTSDDTVSEPGKPTPLPTRFSVINGQVFPDPEGELNWTRAMQLVAQQQGASPADATALAKMGPEMFTNMITALTPLMKKEPAEGGGLSEALKTMKELGVLGKEEDGGIIKTIEVLTNLGLIGGGGEGPSDLDRIAKLAELGLIQKPGAGESDAVSALRTEVVNLKEALTRKDMDSIQGELTAVKGALINIRQELETTRRDQSAKGEYDIMAQVVGVIDRRAGAIENVLTGLVKRPPSPLSLKKKKETIAAIESEVESQSNLHELATVLWPKE